MEVEDAEEYLYMLDIPVNRDTRANMVGDRRHTARVLDAPSKACNTNNQLVDLHDLHRVASCTVHIASSFHRKSASNPHSTSKDSLHPDVHIPCAVCILCSFQASPT